MAILPFPESRQGCCCKAPEWLTLPVTPQAAARSRFSGKEKLSQAMPLHGALAWIADLLDRGTSIAGLNIHGPGDPLAAMAMTGKILAMLREQYPALPCRLTTLGLGLAGTIDLLTEWQVTGVTLLVDAVDVRTIRQLYAWIRPGKKNTPLALAAGILIDDQARGAAACKAAGIPVSLETTVYAGVNEQHVEDIARWGSGLGVESLRLRPRFGWLENGDMLPPPPAVTMADLAVSAGRHLQVVCQSEPAKRGDVVSLPGGGNKVMPRPTRDRPNVAVLSAHGIDIDLHLGHAIKALIYGPREDGLACLLHVRDLPEPGGGDNRWHQLAETLGDCFVLLASSAGQKPRDILARHGLELLLVEDTVEGTVDVLFGGGKKGKK